MIRDVWTVFRREYSQRVKSKAFVLATIGIPVLMVAMVGFSTFVTVAIVGDGQDDPDTIAVVDSTGVLLRPLTPRLAAVGYLTVGVDEGSSRIVETREAVDTGTFSGLLILGERTLLTGEATLYAPELPSRLRRVGIESSVSLAVLDYRAAADTLAGPIPGSGSLRFETSPDGDEGVEEAEIREGVGFALAFSGGLVLYMTILLYAAAVLRATIEEKNSKVVEVIVASVRPTHFMLGKILGVGSAGLTQLAIWLTASVSVLAAGMALVVGVIPPEATEVLTQVRSSLPGPFALFLFVGFFVFGYFIYGGLYAAVGAMCSSEQEAQYAQMPVVVFMVAQVLVLAPIIEAPDSSLAVGASLFPMFTPVLMWARVATGAAAAWEIALSFGLMSLTLFVCAWIAGRIYRIGILSTGKRPSVRELGRWVFRG